MHTALAVQAKDTFPISASMSSVTTTWHLLIEDSTEDMTFWTGEILEKPSECRRQPIIQCRNLKSPRSLTVLHTVLSISKSEIEYVVSYRHTIGQVPRNGSNSYEVERLELHQSKTKGCESLTANACLMRQVGKTLCLSLVVCSDFERSLSKREIRYR